MRSLGNHFNSAVNYEITSTSPKFMWMFRTSRCPDCHHMIVEEVTVGGSMWTCLSGDVYDDGEAGCGKRFWVDE